MTYCSDCGEDYDVDRDSGEWLAHVKTHADSARAAMAGEPGRCPLCDKRAAAYQCLLCDEKRCWDCFAGHDFERHGRPLD